MSQHNHSHSNMSQAQKPDGKYIFGTVLNTAFIVFEFVMAAIIGSVSLYSDAVHNLGDVLGILVAFVGVLFSRKKATKEHTYGLRNTTILAAFTNSAILMVSIGFVIVEAIQRLFNPHTTTDGLAIFLVAGLGVLINGFTAWLFISGSQKDLNEKGVYLHFLTDTLMSVVVAVTGLAIQYTGWKILDPVISLIAISYILYASLDLFRSTWNLLTNGVPEGINETEVEKYLLSIPGVTEINDLHIWGLSTTEAALSVHLECKKIANDTDMIDKITTDLRNKFNIDHVTIQLELPNHKHDESDI